LCSKGKEKGQKKPFTNLHKTKKNTHPKVHKVGGRGERTKEEWEPTQFEGKKRRQRGDPCRGVKNQNPGKGANRKP